MHTAQAASRPTTHTLDLRVVGHAAFFVLCAGTFLALGAHQLGLPGLQYDEVKEAGLNAMQLLLHQPVTAFRDATVQIGPWRLPLMVQDYIGSLNVLLAVPFLAIGGINPSALRWLPLLTGAATLALAWRLAWRLGGPVAASATALLLAVNPSFIFWSRQGIFVTNLTALFFLASLLTGLRWWEERRPRDLWLTALAWGLGLYAKLLFGWAIGAMLIVAAGATLLDRSRPRPAYSWRTWLIAAACFLLPLLPLIAFNLTTGGTLASILGNLGQSYYGVNNLAYWPNLLVRLGELWTLLRGDHLWYLGESYANSYAPWLAIGLVGLAVLAGTSRPHKMPAVLLPLLLLALITLQSAFTVSDLFITHFALALPLVALGGGLAAGALWLARPFRSTAPNVALALLGLLSILTWAGVDARNTFLYHQILTRSGGYSSHSDGIYRLAAYLAAQPSGALLVLDWGMDAQLQFLSDGRLNPIEVFGYASINQPDPGFAARVAPFLAEPHSLFVAHVPNETVFKGRVAALAALARAQGENLREQGRFGLRSGQPLFIVYTLSK